jgi:hypothetical protein
MAIISWRTVTFTVTLSAAFVLAPLAGSRAADERESVEELRNTVINLLQGLVDQGVISREKAAQMVKAAKDKAVAEAAQAAKNDEGAVRVPYVPQIVKDEIAKQVEESVKPSVVAQVLDDARAQKWGVPGALPNWLTRTRVSGDVTLREEDILFAADNLKNFYYNYYAINQAGGFQKAGINALENVSIDRARFRGRAHLAFESSLTDSLTAGVRLATGNTSDLVSETQTFDGTSPYQFGVDEAYIRLDERNSRRFPWLSAVVGRFENPYSAPTNLVFHWDLTFTGTAATARLGFGDGGAEQSHLFFTVGAHPLQEVALSPQDKWLVAGQLGTLLHFEGDQQLRIAAGFFDYLNVTGRLNPPNSTIYNYTAPTFLRQGNTYFDIANSTDPTVNLYALAAKFRLANLNVFYQLPIARYTLTVTGDAVRNLAYDANRVSAEVGKYVAARTKGYQGEIGFGSPTVLVPGAWRTLIGYRYLQRDAVIDAYTDSDFHWGGTDAQGYYLVGQYGVAARVWLRLTYMSSNAIDYPTLKIDTVQLDLNTRF